MTLTSNEPTVAISQTAIDRIQADVQKYLKSEKVGASPESLRKAIRTLDEQYHELLDHFEGVEREIYLLEHLDKGFATEDAITSSEERIRKYKIENGNAWQRLGKIEERYQQDLEEIDRNIRGTLPILNERDELLKQGDVLEEELQSLQARSKTDESFQSREIEKLKQEFHSRATKPAAVYEINQEALAENSKLEQDLANIEEEINSLQAEKGELEQLLKEKQISQSPFRDEELKLQEWLEQEIKLLRCLWGISEILFCPDHTIRITLSVPKISVEIKYHSTTGKVQRVRVDGRPLKPLPWREYPTTIKEALMEVFLILDS